MKIIFFLGLNLVLFFVACINHSGSHTEVDGPKTEYMEGIEHDTIFNDANEIAVQNTATSTDTLTRLDSKQTEKDKIEIKKSKTPKKDVVKRVPNIYFTNTVYDFGEITEGDIVEHKFEFENKGNAPLVIRKATATCGCTAPSYPFVDIKPGETGYIGVRYNSVGKDGPQSAEIEVYSNAKTEAMTLQLKGEVVSKEEGKERS